MAFCLIWKFIKHDQFVRPKICELVSGPIDLYACDSSFYLCALRTMRAHDQIGKLHEMGSSLMKAAGSAHVII